MSIIEAFIKTISFFDELKDEGIIEDYALIGGLALSAWVRPRTTRDVDLVVIISKKINWDDLISLIQTRLQKKVSVHKATPRMTIQEKFSFMSGHIQVDIIGTGGFDLATEAIKNGVVAAVFGKNIKVATPEYLILLKLLPLSGQDIIDIKGLAKKADMHKVAKLAEKHFLLPKLESIIQLRKP
ncbi:MAG: nucleotidyl transferase AbiEii/AbiGii toxin family protein [Nitrospirae bacterium]|nr:nucleotidyl transferase AbiEii/AbiGii toxin family protein [Nitrospirota bacterium]MCL5977076.1 nucleotidyl transferase AbiEii/AbiGii toxin family protein [Nitrospirota bacterium]